MVFQRKQNQLRRQRINRIYRRHIRLALIDNESTLRQIANLPQQITINDPLITQFFNGFAFY
jgi:hypothetical protein